MANDNCLENLRCPKCKNADRLFIVGTSEFEVHDDGTEGHGDIEWDEQSSCRCPACDFTATLADFRIRKRKVKPAPKRRVTIEVSGGVAYVESCPDDIEVFILDYDDQETEEGYIAQPCRT